MYTDRLFLKALVIIIICRLYKVTELPSWAGAANHRDSDIAIIVARTGQLSLPSDMRTTLESNPANSAYPNQLLGLFFSNPAPSVGQCWPSHCHR